MLSSAFLGSNVWALAANLSSNGASISSLIKSVTTIVAGYPRKLIDTGDAKYI